MTDGTPDVWQCPHCREWYERGLQAAKDRHEADLQAAFERGVRAGKKQAVEIRKNKDSGRPRIHDREKLKERYDALVADGIKNRLVMSVLADEFGTDAATIYQITAQWRRADEWRKRRRKLAEQAE